MAKSIGHMFSGMVETDASWDDAVKGLNSIQDKLEESGKWRAILVDSKVERHSESGKRVAWNKYEARSKVLKAVKLADFTVMIVEHGLPEGRIALHFNLDSTLSSSTSVMGIRIGKPEVPGLTVVAPFYSGEMKAWAASKSDNWEQGWKGGNG